MQSATLFALFFTLPMSALAEPPATVSPHAIGDFDPQTALMTVVEPKMEVDPTSISPLGDDYDPSTGSITFSTTDISLPGNFDIPVELRRWVPKDDYDTGGPTGWAWNIPFVRGNYLDVKDGHVDTGWDWGPASWHTGENCTASAQVVIDNKGEAIGPEAYWQGKLLHIPGVTSEAFLEKNSGQQQVTKSNFKVASCINNANGQQGMVVAGPNGLTYTFNQIKSYYNRKPALKDPIVRTRLLMVSKIEDRFGNYVNYTYSGGNLTKISASDGRTITISYETVGSKQRPKSATAHGQTWLYTYQAASPGYLASVTLPDGVSTWQYTNLQVMAFNPMDLSNNYSPVVRLQDNRVPTCTFQPEQQEVVVVNPGGVRSAYTFKKVVHSRSDVEPSVYTDQYEDYTIARAVNCTVQMSLVKKDVTGPGLAPATWNYQYSTHSGTYNASSGFNSYLTGPFNLPVPAVGGYPLPITTATAVNYRTTTINGPGRKTVFYIDRKAQSIDENRIVAEDTLNTAGTQLLARKQYVTALGDFVGSHWFMCISCTHPPVNEKQLSYRINQTKTIEKRYAGGSTTTYAAEYSGFDQYGRPTKIVRSSSSPP